MGYINTGTQHRCPSANSNEPCLFLNGYCTHQKLCSTHRNFSYLSTQTCGVCAVEKKNKEYRAKKAKANQGSNKTTEKVIVKKTTKKTIVKNGKSTTEQSTTATTSTADNFDTINSVIHNITERHNEIIDAIPVKKLLDILDIFMPKTNEPTGKSKDDLFTFNFKFEGDRKGSGGSGSGRGV